MLRFTGALEQAGFRGLEIDRRARLFCQVADHLPNPRPFDQAWWHIPGRVEILGKHTDYAGGRSLVCATEQGMAVSAAPRSDGMLRVADAGRGSEVLIPLAVEGPPRKGDWSTYPATVVARLVSDFGPIEGLDLVFASDIPVAAGVSSSSALVIAVALALMDRNHLDQRPVYQRNLSSPVQLAGYLGAMENGRPFGEFASATGVGTMGGSQDHTAILCSQSDTALQCRWDPLAVERGVPWPGHLRLALASSGVAAEKTGGALLRYNGLASMTAELNALVSARPGQSVGRMIIDAAAGASFSSEREVVGCSEDRARLLARFDQLIYECRIAVPEFADALGEGATRMLGPIAAESQARAELALDNQIDETRSLVRLALAEGANAASAFGAGFGGSVWALVEEADVNSMLTGWEWEYRAAFPGRSAARFFATRPAPGAVRLEL